MNRDKEIIADLVFSLSLAKGTIISMIISVNDDRMSKLYEASLEIIDINLRNAFQHLHPRPLNQEEIK